MDQTGLLISICTLLWLCSSDFCSCLYDEFNNCAPAKCGVNGVFDISYPFHLNGLQPSYCGESGYKMSCTPSNDSVIITIGSSTLVVVGINYTTQHLQVYADTFQHVEETCSVPDKNVSMLDPNFALVGVHNWLVLYTGCNKPLPSNLTLYAHSNCSDPVLMMLFKDPQSGLASKECQRRVHLPVEIYDGELSLNQEDLATKGAGAHWKQYKNVLQRGIKVYWRAPSCADCINGGGRCGYLNDSDRMCFCRDGAFPSTCPPGRLRSERKMVISLVVSVAGLALLTIVVFLLIQKKRRKNPRNIIDFLRNSESLTPKRYKYSDIKKITQSFKYKLGQGGFGIVYKGKLEDGRLVAVKVLNSVKSSDGEDFINEVTSISRTSHVNIVSLIGYCVSGAKRAVIYQFMVNGSLEKFIYKEKLSEQGHVLGWDKLHSIAVGIAQGLEYLHRGCNTRILHLDIKPHNILLDEDFCPKVSDFGLAKVCKHKESAVSMLGARGTVGFIAPEQVCRNLGQVSHKSDVYSYGMMILEMVGGRKNIDADVADSNEFYFPHWVYRRILSNQQLGLNGITDEYTEAMARKMVMVGLWCIQTYPANRPPISLVIDMLQGSTELLSVPPKPYMYSPSSSPQHFSAFVASSALSQKSTSYKANSSSFLS